MSTTKGKPGRPKQPERDRVRHSLPVKFSMADIDRLKDEHAMDDAQMEFSAWIRRKLGL